MKASQQCPLNLILLSVQYYPGCQFPGGPEVHRLAIWAESLRIFCTKNALPASYSRIRYRYDVEILDDNRY